VELSWQVLELHTRHAFNIARAVAPSVRRTVWLRLIDDDGVEGWGEAAPNAYYGETAETVTALLPRYAEVLADVRADGVHGLDRIEKDLMMSVRRNAAARSALSAALHDLAGKRLGVPVWKLWGLDPAAVPPSCFSIGIDDIGAMRERVAEAKAYPILKIKVGTDRDDEILGMVRAERPDAIIRVDANTGWTVKQAVRNLPMLEEIGIELIEEPLAPDDFDGLRLLRERSSIPIIADESCRNADDIPRLAGCVDGINIKLAKCGSLREAVRMVHVARAHRMRVMLGCMIESTLAVAGAMQIAPLVDYVDVDAPALLADDPFEGPGMDGGGTLVLNTEPGLGVKLRE
jgi:L-alanine-DL-glutamate epimerase-like enolase superfamily enzyme